MASRVIAGLAALLCLGGTLLPWFTLPGLGEFGFRDLGAWQRGLAFAAAGVSAISYLLGWRWLGLVCFCLFGLILFFSLGQTAMMLRELAPSSPAGAAAGAEPPWRKILQATEFHGGAIITVLGFLFWALSFVPRKSR